MQGEIESMGRGEKCDGPLSPDELAKILEAEGVDDERA